MIRQDELDYVIDEIKKRKDRPYMMANEILADEIYPYLAMEFNDICLVKVEGNQYFIVNEKARKKLKKLLQKKLEELRKKESEIERVLEKLS